MPNIRILNWNIEQLSNTKAQIAGTATNIGKIIARSQADIVLIMEVRSGNPIAVMTAVSAAANARSVATGGAATNYRAWLLSYDTGGECYGVLVRDLNLVRPIVVNAGPTGAANDTLDNLDRNAFVTWPGTFAATANAYPLLAGLLIRPALPLINVFASRPPAGRTAATFFGQTLGNGGYALGRGFRLPCLAMFEVLHGGGTYLIPIIACHLGAVRGGKNFLALGQIMQYKDTSIAQKFQNGGYINLNNAARAVQNLVFTGDFNVDFLQNNAHGATSIQRANRAALNMITPTSANGGAALPAALPGAPAHPAPAVPFVRPLGGWPAGPVRTQIPRLALKAGVTTQGTILNTWSNFSLGDPARGACFDHFYIGGANLSGTLQTLTPGGNPDAGQVTDLMPLIVAGAAPAGGTALLDLSRLNVSGAWTHYAAQNTRNANTLDAQPLGPAAAVPVGGLPQTAQLIGARFISDHLPTTVQFNLP